MTFHLPPSRTTPEGAWRKTGFEFEMAGIGIKECAELVAGLFEGNVRYHHSLAADVESAYGKFKVELDSHSVTKLTSSLEQDKEVTEDDIIDVNKLRSGISEVIGSMAKTIIPCEITTPPLEFKQLPMLETLRRELCKKNAEGTGAGLAYAFGMHINPDIASTKVNYLRDIMRAFLILYPWLKEAMAVDATRRLMVFIDPFPEAYVKLVLAERYTPTLKQFIQDYLTHNPTRNRALDMLPLFVHLHPGTLLQIDEGSRKLIKPRPTFHYRLPNCEMDDPQWRISRDWNYWVEVERLAENKRKLAAMAVEYLAFLDKKLHYFSHDWVEKVSEQFGYAA